MGNLRRREFLKGSAVLAGAAATGAFSCVEMASAAPTIQCMPRLPRILHSERATYNPLLWTVVSASGRSTQPLVQDLQSSFQLQR